MQCDVSFGRIGVTKRAAPGPAFRLAVLGDFSGRANAGLPETGARLAARKPQKVDVDNLDALLERLAPSVSVPMGEDGTALSACIKAMDDFHPDQLVGNLPVFADLLQLRRDLQRKSGFERAAKEVLSWAGETALPPLTSRDARGMAIAKDRRLSDFARLTGRKPAAEMVSKNLIRRLVGPFVVPASDFRQDALVARVDFALSDAMRRVLHHPDFQTAEALWRGLEFLVRRIETDGLLQIVLYDLSAEELAADLAASEPLENSALHAMLVEQPSLDADQGPLSMVAGLYHFEATPPHADLLGRIARSPAQPARPSWPGSATNALKAPMHDWHALSRAAWSALRDLPASAYLGLVTPRFLLRMPYGRKTDPIDAFAFEEFTRQSGLSGMLWGHPAVLFANLVAETWRRGGPSMPLGSIATVADLPVYTYHDRDGEQIALPCTERLLSESQAARVAAAGVNPVLTLRGRPEVRLGGFRSLAGTMLAGRWAPVELKPISPKAAMPAAATPVASHAVVEPAETAAKPPSPANPQGGLPLATETDQAEAPAVAKTSASGGEAAATDDLDALLASLNVQPPAPPEDATDPDLDALLASLK